MPGLLFAICEMYMYMTVVNIVKSMRPAMRMTELLCSRVTKAVMGTYTAAPSPTRSTLARTNLLSHCMALEECVDATSPAVNKISKDATSSSR
jgi:hypothetical protein